MAIPTPYSYRQYTGDGAATDFSVPFPYLNRVHVHLYLNQTELVEGTDFVWTSGTQVQLTTAPQGPVAGTPPTPAEVLTVRRITPEDDQLVQWQDGSYIIEADLNESDLQWLYLIQEHHDQIMILTWGLGGSGLLPGPGSPGLSYSWWNNLARHVDPAKGTTTELANTVDTEDQKAGDWISDDKHVATTGAIAERLDVYVQDARPPAVPLGEIRQPGKLWFDDGLLQMSVWEPSANAWVNISATGPVGPAGTVTVGTTTTGAAGTNAAVTNSGTATAAVLDFTIPRGDTGPAGPPGTGVDLTFAGTAPITVTRAGTTPATITYAISPATTSALGAVMVGANLTVAADGTLSANLPGALIYKGTADLTAAPGTGVTTGLAPGHLYVSSTAGTIDAGWTGIGGQATAIGEMVVWDGTRWDVVGVTGNNPVTSVTGTAPVVVGGTTAAPVISVNNAVASVGGTGGSAGLITAADLAKLNGIAAGAQPGTLTAVTGTAPVTIGGTATVPNVSVANASTTAAGLMTAADKAKLDGIATGAQAGTVTSVTATTPIKVATGTTTPALSILTATASDLGVVRLADAAAVTAGTAGRVVTADLLKTTNDALANAITTITATKPLRVTGTGASRALAVDAATASDPGVIQIATQAQVDAGTSTNTAVTPATLKTSFLPHNVQTLTLLP